jgi:hypothetical protein
MPEFQIDISTRFAAQGNRRGTLLSAISILRVGADKERR